MRVAEALDLLEGFVRGPARREAVERFAAAGDGPAALNACRSAMATHRWPGAGGAQRSLRSLVDALDARTRAEGLHVLFGWDFAAQRRPADIAPALLVDYCARLGVSDERLRTVLATLVDHYCVGVVSVIAVRAWDDGDAESVLGRLDQVVATIEGADGSGRPVVGDVETAILLGVAYFHPEEDGYFALLGRLATLGADRALRFAIPCATVFSSHLRWGMRFMYRSDAGALRADNGMDYPWVLRALLTLATRYDAVTTAGGASGSRERLRAAEGILGALAPDPWAFTGAPPSALKRFAAEHELARSLLVRHRDALLADFDAVAPTTKRYSPMAFGCNFVSNASVALATLSATDAERYPALNALWSAAGASDAECADAERLAKRLMRYSTEDPSRLGAHGAPLVAYDVRDGVHHTNVVRRVLGELPAP